MIGIDLRAGVGWIDGKAAAQSRTTRALKRRITRRCADPVKIGLRISEFATEPEGIREIDVSLDISLIAVFFLDQIIKGNEAETAYPVWSTTRFGTAHVRTQAHARDDECPRRCQSRPGSRIYIIWLEPVVASGRWQFGAMLPAEAGHDIQVTKILADQNGCGVVVVRSFDKIIVALNFNTFEAFFGDEVRDTGNGIGTICCRGSVFQDFDAIQGEERYRVGITKAAADCTRCGQRPPAIEQHQCARWAEIAEVDRTEALISLRVGGELV